MLALQTREERRSMLAAATPVEVCPIGWNKYGGRLDAMVWADGIDAGEALVRRGLARAYDSGKRGGGAINV